MTKVAVQRKKMPDNRRCGATFVIRHSGLIRHSDFGIRHSR
jgi:hypothetical protein